MKIATSSMIQRSRPSGSAAAPGPASSTLSCDASKLVRGMSRDQLKIVCGNPQRINRRFFNDLEEQWVFPNDTHVEVGHGLVTSWSQHYSTQGEVK